MLTSLNAHPEFSDAFFNSFFLARSSLYSNSVAASTNGRPPSQTRAHLRADVRPPSGGRRLRDFLPGFDDAGGRSAAVAVRERLHVYDSIDRGGAERAGQATAQATGSKDGRAFHWNARVHRQFLCRTKRRVSGVRLDKHNLERRIKLKKYSLESRNRMTQLFLQAPSAAVAGATGQLLATDGDFLYWRR